MFKQHDRDYLEPIPKRKHPVNSPRFWPILVALVFSVTLLGLGVYGGVRYLWSDSPGAVKPSAIEQEQHALAKDASAILHTHCRRCHGQDGAMEGGFNHVMDRQRLVDRHQIVPGQPDQSKLLRRILDGEMPPEEEKQRPSKEEVAVLRRWIESGAPEFGPSEPNRKTIPLAKLPRIIRDDLVTRPERDRRFLRYFTLTHLYNRGLADDELQSYRNALSKLVNSLSWGRDIVVPQAVDEEKTVYRIDLRDYKWEGSTWERILADFPYGSVTDAIGQELTASTGCPLPYVRADWFTAVASRPPLYYDLLQMPATDRELETLLRVDAAKDINSERVIRAGFSNSGVSRHNRIIERHESSYGAYWKSYDFAGETNSKNIFASPLGPGGGPNSFQADGSEMIFDLPNGLHAYFLVDSSGRRMDQAPPTIVSDPKRPERAVVAGLSCLSCHSRGLNDKTDQVRAHVQKNMTAFSQSETNTILALYPPGDRFEELLRGDIDHYRQALQKTGTRWGVSDPIETLTARFEADVDLLQAATEVGVSTRQLEDAIAASPELGRALGAIRVDGGTTPRRVFADSFGAVLRTLGLGEPLRPGGGLALPPTVKERTEFNLPETFTAVTTGGGGRLLIFYLKKAKKLAIFDVLQAKIVHEIEVPADDVCFAAGRDKLLVVLPGAKIIQRWNLRTFQREKTVPIPTGLTITQAKMGYNSQGPLALWGNGAVVFFDVERMELLELEGGGIGGSARWNFHLRVSPDGQVFVGWLNDITPSPFTVLRLSGRKATQQIIEGGSQNERWIMPNADGSNLIVGISGLLNADLKSYPTADFKDSVLLATADPRFFLAASAPPHGVSLCTTADRHRIVTVVDKVMSGMNGSSVPLRWFLINREEPRIRYLPEADVVVFLPMNDKQIVVRPMNLLNELEKAGHDYLFVLSQPKLHGKAGGVYHYQMEVKSKSGGVTYQLEKGPDGMTVSAGGELRWNIPPNQAGKSTPVIISVKNAGGKDIFHTFDLTVD